MDARRTGEVLLAAADDLVRLWRATRERAGAARASRIERLVDALVLATGQALVRGAPAAASAQELSGIVRVDPRDRDGSRRDIDEEWTALAQVLASTAETVGADPAARAELAGAVDAARAATDAALRGASASHIVIVWQWTWP